MNLQKFRPIVAKSVLRRSLTPSTSSCITPVQTVCRIEDRKRSTPFANQDQFVRQLSTGNVRMSSENAEDVTPKKILVEQNFKVPSFGGILSLKTPVNVQVHHDSF
jgi:hypothetical protein